MNNEEKMRAIRDSIENGDYELWHEDEKLKELEWKEHFLRGLLNIFYGALKRKKLLNDIQKEYKEVKQQLKNYKAD